MKQEYHGPNSVDGFTVALVLFSLRQDYLGLEGTIQSLRENWLDSRITVPLAIIVFLIVIGHNIFQAYRSLNDRSKHEDC